MSRKIVYNSKYGRFHLSLKAMGWLHEHGKKVNEWGQDIERHDPVLVECVKTLGKEASGALALLKICTIKDTDKYRIEEYDGLETVVTGYNDWK